MDQEQRIAELEDDLKDKERRIMELTAERDAEREAVSKMREYTEDAHAMVDQWIAAFDMELADNGKWSWGTWVRERDDLNDELLALHKKWNKFTVEYNGRIAKLKRNFGRPLAASDDQKANVLKRRRSGQSLRSIADETGLSFQTVRTIIDKADGVDRATLARLQRIAPDKLKEAKERINKRTRAALPGRITAMHKRAKDLLKTVKGLADAK
jgi:hypothetical protein